MPDIKTPYEHLTFLQSFVVLLLGLIMLGYLLAMKYHIKSIRISQTLLALSYLILGTAGFIELYSAPHDTDPALVTTITLIAASFQACLFTFTFLTLIDPAYIAHRILRQVIPMVLLSAMLLTCYLMGPVQLHRFITRISILGYIIQLAYYTWLFFSKYKIARTAVTGPNKLCWVRLAFLSALFIGIFALAEIVSPWNISIPFIIVCILFYTLFSYVFNDYARTLIYNDIILRYRAENKLSPSDNLNENSTPLMDDEKNYAPHKEYIDNWIAGKSYLNETSRRHLIKEMGLNRNSFARFFRGTYCCDFKAWLNTLRLEEAKQMLVEYPDKPICEISDHVCMSRSTFHRLFSQKYNCTPLEYRQQVTKSTPI